MASDRHGSETKAKVDRVGPDAPAQAEPVDRASGETDSRTRNGDGLIGAVSNEAGHECRLRIESSPSNLRNSKVDNQITSLGLKPVPVVGPGFGCSAVMSFAPLPVAWFSTSSRMYSSGMFGRGDRSRMVLSLSGDKIGVESMDMRVFCCKNMRLFPVSAIICRQ
jgi:hypothetical protein